MQNLDQLRAKNALEPAEGLDRSAVNKLPAMIIANGLLATAAFCQAEGGGDRRGQMKAALEATAEHLAKRSFIPANNTTVKGLIDYLATQDSDHLQRATTEALAFIAYLKRFAPPKKD